MKNLIQYFLISMAMFQTQAMAHTATATAINPAAISNVAITEIIPPEFLNLEPTIGVVSPEVAQQRMINYGVDLSKISNVKIIGNNFQFSAIVDGVSTELEINGLTGNVQDLVAQQALRPPFAEYERVMNWGEAIAAPDLLPSGDRQDFDYPPFKVRYYPSTNTYLGYNPNDGFIYIYNPQKFGEGIQQLAPMKNYLGEAKREGL